MSLRRTTLPYNPALRERGGRRLTYPTIRRKAPGEWHRTVNST
jgi:hypothetical protein